MKQFHITQLDRSDEKVNSIWKNQFFNFDGYTIFHSPDFLSYHKSKFDEHHLGFVKGNTVFGLCPLALVREEGKIIAKSPYGASYGGMIFSKVLSYKESKEIQNLFIEYLSNLGVDEFIMTPPLRLYCKNYSDTFLFSFYELGLKVINSDISSIVELNDNYSSNLKSRVKRACKEASKFDLHIDPDAKIEDFWLIIEKTFIKHGVTPTHKFEEMKLLKEKLKREISFPVVYLDSKPLAGVAIFEINNRCVMSFYICQDDEYRNINAQSYLINYLLNDYNQKGFCFFDFGTSSVSMKARPNIFEFKEGFGAIGEFRHSYKLEIK